MIKFKWKPEHRKFLSRIRFDFDINGELTEEQVFEAVEKVADYLQTYGLNDINGHKIENSIGRMCENIINYMNNRGE